MRVYEFGPLRFPEQEDMEIREGKRRTRAYGSDGSIQEFEAPEIAVTKKGVTVRYRLTDEGVLVI